jgi:hypothetical protein
MPVVEQIEGNGVRRASIDASRFAREPCCKELDILSLVGLGRAF